MQLFNNGTHELLATKFFVKYHKKEFVLDTLDDGYGDLDLDSVNGKYHLFKSRIEDHQLNWSNGETVVIRDGKDAPKDTEHHYYEYIGYIIVSGLEHDHVNVTKQATVEFYSK